jgi:hypothetical protein
MLSPLSAWSFPFVECNDGVRAVGVRGNDGVRAVDNTLQKTLTYYL